MYYWMRVHWTKFKIPVSSLNPVAFNKFSVNKMCINQLYIYYIIFYKKKENQVDHFWFIINPTQQKPLFYTYHHYFIMISLIFGRMHKAIQHILARSWVSVQGSISCLHECSHACKYVESICPQWCSVWIIFFSLLTIINTSKLIISPIFSVPLTAKLNDYRRVRRKRSKFPASVIWSYHYVIVWLCLWRDQDFHTHTLVCNSKKYYEDGQEQQ